jgi:hypothetical protein
MPGCAWIADAINARAIFCAGLKRQRSGKKWTESPQCKHHCQLTPSHLLAMPANDSRAHVGQRREADTS